MLVSYIAIQRMNSNMMTDYAGGITSSFSLFMQSPFSSNYHYYSLLGEANISHSWAQRAAVVVNYYHLPCTCEREAIMSEFHINTKFVNGKVITLQ